jgi:hypothetical protein
MGVLERITADPAIFGGKPIIRGMRVSVQLVLSLLAQGETMITPGWSRTISAPALPTPMP